MVGQGVPIRVETSPDDVNAIGGGPQGGMVAQEVVAGDHGIASSNHGGKPAGTRRAIASLRGIRVAQENGVVEIKEQHVGRSSQERQLPGRNQLALKNDEVGPTQLAAQPPARQPRLRPGAHGQLVPFLLPDPAVGRQPIAATNMVRAFDKSRNSHRAPISSGHGNSFGRQQGVVELQMAASDHRPAKVLSLLTDVLTQATR